MNTQDRNVVKALLQYLTDKCLVDSDEFREALKHFRVTTTWQGKDIESDEAAALLKIERNHFVQVYYPAQIDTNKYGQRFWFKTAEEAAEFAARERSSEVAKFLAAGDNLPAANPELVAALNDAPVDTRVQDVETAYAEAQQWNDFVDSFDGISKKSA